MSQRPQPVTSKFRSYYLNDIYPIFDGSNKTSSAGSTSSLTSVLHHDSFDDQSIESDFNESDKLNKNINQLHIEPIPITGMYCKRIIARQPQYPGERITLTKYDSMINNLSKTIPSRVTNKTQAPYKQKLNKSSVPNFVFQSPNLNNGDRIQPKSLVRKIAGKAPSISIQSNVKKSETIPDDKSEDNYSTNDFSSVSGDRPATQISENKVINDDLCSSIEDTLSVSIDDRPCDLGDAPIQKDNSNKILTAWEAWYLKKEKQKRKKQETELSIEKGQREKNDEEKSKRTQVCHEKIESWLIKKQELMKKEANIIKKQQEKEKHAKEQKKEELLKKSSEKYVEWKLEKQKQEKELEKQDTDLKIKNEAEKMIKKAKAANAFQRWFDEHKDHQTVVPYSYGISDGKLTSYYDKTSNPPPSFFNPDPWKPIIDLKN